MENNEILLDREIRLKRLRMRAWRRGMKEMDLILGGFVDKHAASLTTADMDALEVLMNRQDQQLFSWISQGIAAPADSTSSERDMVERVVDNLSGT